MLALAGAAVLGCNPLGSTAVGPSASPSPLLSPSSTASSPPTAAPAPQLIFFQPSELVLPLQQFPLSGYKITDDRANGGATWRRTFEPSGAGLSDFAYVAIDLSIYLDPSSQKLPGSLLFATSRCDTKSYGASSDGTIPSAGDLVTGPKVGDGSSICAFTFKNGVRYDLGSANRNAFVYIQVAPRFPTSSQSAPDLAISVARIQWATVDRLSPP